jgi:hypothetical protein
MSRWRTVLGMQLFCLFMINLSDDFSSRIMQRLIGGRHMKGHKHGVSEENHEERQSGYTKSRDSRI